jgi:hypothetical protein
MTDEQCQSHVFIWAFEGTTGCLFDGIAEYDEMTQLRKK